MIDDFLNAGVYGYGSDDLSPDDVSYLQRYWMTLEELSHVWAPVIDKTFARSSSGVSVVGAQSVDVRRGGVLFVETEFKDFQLEARRHEAKRFAIVEDIGQVRWQGFEDTSFFRFCYPVDISWEELSRSCPLAEDVFQRPIRCFFVVLDNGAGGKYADNDVEVPYEIVFTRRN